MTKFALIVNAGGDSRRMGGKHKALLPVPPRGQFLVNYIIDLLAPLASAGAIVVANSPEVQKAARSQDHLAVKVVSDIWPRTGSMGGIATGLTLCAEWAITVACDMPFLNPDLVGLLCELAGEVDHEGQRRWDAVVPLVNGYPQMLHTLYHADMLPIFRRCMQEGDLKLLNVLRDARVRYVSEEEMAPLDPGFRSFINVNTPQEWERARQALKAAASVSGSLRNE